MRAVVLCVLAFCLATAHAARYVAEEPLSPGKQVWQDQDGLIDPVVEGEEKTILRLSPPTDPKLVVPNIVDQKSSLPAGGEVVYTSSAHPALVIGSNMCCENELCPQPCPTLEISPEADLPPSAAVPRGCCGLPGCPGPQPCPVAPQTSCCDELCPKPHPPHCFDLDSVGDSVLPFADITPAQNGTRAGQNGTAEVKKEEEKDHKKKVEKLEKDKIEFEKDADEAKALRKEQEEVDVKERKVEAAEKMAAKAEKTEKEQEKIDKEKEKADAEKETKDALEHNTMGSEVEDQKMKIAEKEAKEMSKEEKETDMLAKKTKVEVTKAKLEEEEILQEEEKVTAKEKKAAEKLKKDAKEVEAAGKATGDAAADEKKAEEEDVAKRLVEAEKQKAIKATKEEEADLKKKDVKGAEEKDKERKEADKEEEKAVKEVEVAEKEKKLAQTEEKLEQEKLEQKNATKAGNATNATSHEEVTDDTADDFHFHIRSLPEGHYYKEEEASWGHDGDNDGVNTETSSEEEQNDLHHKNDDLKDNKAKGNATAGDGGAVKGEASGSMGQELQLIAQDRDALMKQVQETKAKLAKLGASPQKTDQDIKKLVTKALKADIGNIDDDLPKNTQVQKLDKKETEKLKAAEEAEADEIKEALAMAEQLVQHHDEAARLELALAVERIMQEQHAQDKVEKEKGAETVMQEAEDGDLESLQAKLKSISDAEVKAGHVTKEDVAQVEKQAAEMLKKLAGLVGAQQQ